jgi:hypothetical protein
LPPDFLEDLRSQLALPLLQSLAKLLFLLVWVGANV